MKRLRILLSLLLLVLAISVMPFASLQAQDSTFNVDDLPPLPDDIGTLQVGYIPITGFAPFFVAQELGYFEELGLDIELMLFRSGDPMIAPLSLGQLDVGGGETGPALINAFNQGLDVRVVSGLTSQAEGFGAVPLLVRTDLFESGAVTTPGDLSGMRVAVNIERGNAEFLLASGLEQFGLSVEDVELITIPFPEMPAALANEAVDAAILPHPLAGTPLREGDAVVLMEGHEMANDPQNGVIYFGQRLLEEENREVGIRFLMAYLQAARDLQDTEEATFRENDAVVSAILEWTNVPEPAVRGGVTYFFDPNGGINLDSTEDIVSYHVNNGYTEADELPDFGALIASDMLEEALERVGAVEMEEEEAEE